MRSLHRPDPLLALGLLFMRVAAAVLVMHVHGLPKLLHWSSQVQLIEDPFGLGPTFSLAFAVFAEVFCPVLLILGIYARLACLPMLGVLAVALGVVHAGWTIEEGQFAWLLVILFAGLALTGPGPWVLGKRASRVSEGGELFHR